MPRDPTETAVLSAVRERRAAAGLSQGELAARVGVSRQALGAIEAGRQVPSTQLALQLARALGCGVDALFSLALGPHVEARLAGHAGAGGADQRVVLGRVDGELVAHPLHDGHDGGQAADGVLRGAPQRGRVQVELLSEPAQVEAQALVAGCAPLLGVLAARLGHCYRDVRASWIRGNSGRALELLAGRRIHLAGIHLADAGDASAHVRAAQRALPGQRASLINLARWTQGLLVAPGNPLAIAPGEALLRPGLRWVVREPGAAAQQLLERVLREAGPLGQGGDADGPSVERSAIRAADHAEVARLVRWGLADVGVAIESAALAEGLDFIPLSQERFDLVVPDSRLGTPCVARLLELIDRPAFRVEASGLPGYDLSLAGHVSAVPSSAPPSPSAPPVV